jgi:excisionase family DNA binding protein
LRSTNQNELTEYMMSPEQLALFLGLGRTYTYQLLKSKAIPSIRIGRLRRIRRADAERFVEACLERDE